MASKFMAFENVASTSSASMDNSEDTNGEHIEMNSGLYPNYQSNQSHTMTNVSNPYGAVDEDDNDENLDEKPDDNVGYRKFIYNNSEQFKSICGGLLLLLGSGIHIVWGIFRVFNLYNCKETNSFYLRTVIWSWYIGAIIGNCVAGYALVKFRKGHLYFTGAALFVLSGIFLMFSGYDINLFASRLIGGFTHGLIYVVVVVHASDNATKEFREFLMLIVGAVLNYSILLSVLAFFHTEGLFKTDLLNGLGLISFGICSAIITSKHSTETVPFILQNNGSELDALQTVSKLKKKPLTARSVHHDFLMIKNLVQDEMEQYGTPEFRKVLLPENRNSFIFCCYGRLCSVLSFNLPLIVMIMLFLRNWTDSTFEAQGTSAMNYCLKNLSYAGEHNDKALPMKNDNDEIEINAPLERIIQKRHAESTETNIDKPKTLDHKSEGDKEKQEKSKNSKDEVTEDKETFIFMEEKIGDNKDVIIEEKISDKTEKESNSEKDENKHKDDKEKMHEKGEDIQEKDHVNEKNHHGESTKEILKEMKSKTGLSEEKLSKEKEHEKKPQEGHKEHKEHTETKGEENKEKIASKEKELPKKESNSKSPEGANEKELHKKELNSKSPEGSNKQENNKAVSSPTFFAHLIIFLHSRELTLVLLAWFIFGTITAAVLYTFNLKRFIYYISCVLSCVLTVAGLAHSFNLLSGILHFCLIVYFNYVTIPIDVFGHCMLAEAFPVTLKPFSVASVAIIEHLVHIIVITLYLSEWFHNSILLLMCIVAFISHEIARNLPQKGNLPLAEARAQYQNINLMLFNEPKTGYNQQQEFI